MEKIPRNIKIGGALGFLGGAISIACLAFFFRPEEAAILEMGVYMLIAVMFFSLAGGFARGGQWSWDVLLLMTFLTIGVVCSSMIFDIVDVYAGGVLIAIGILIVACLSMSSAKTWTDRIRF